MNRKWNARNCRKVLNRKKAVLQEAVTDLQGQLEAAEATREDRMAAQIQQAIQEGTAKAKEQSTARLQHVQNLNRELSALNQQGQFTKSRVKTVQNFRNSRTY